FPWLFLFFLGVFAYRLSLPWNLGWSVISIAVFVVLSLIGLNLDYRSKYDMSVGYFLLSCLLLFGSFFLARRFEFFQKQTLFNPLIFFGQNSLLFLFVHLVLIGMLSWRLQLDENVRLFRTYPILFWLSIMAITWILMAAFIYSARLPWLEKQFDKIWIWILLTVFVLVIPAILSHNGLIRWTEAGLGVIAALYYHQLARALKQGQTLAPE
ncbi:MAG: hypothetical protein HY258_12180, partial [Chloroflexi bacterium]|nr:hypothetical protein [Chloroflexota bacterium]